MKHKVNIAIFIALFLSISLTIPLSAEESGDWYLAPTISHIKTDESRINEDDGFGYALALGKEINERFNVEIDLARYKFDTFSGNDIGQTGFDVDGLFFLSRNNTFSPYLTAGIGIVSTDRNATGINGANDDTNATWAGGLGLFTNLGVLNNVKLRTEVRFEQEVDSSDLKHDDVQYTVGLNFPIGKSTPAAPIITKPVDSDGDGVNDADDKCPATPAGTAVNSFGCKVDGDSDNDGVKDSRDQCPNTPRGVVVDSNGCKIDGDSDNDGVKDSMDQCPNTAAGTVVDSRGCPVDPDSDNDGVPDSKDQCPNSAPGVRIDFKGCEIRDVISLPGINFEVNSAQLTASSAATLDGAAETLNKYTDISAEVAGHTDSTGADSYNMSLSGKRAQSVKEYLISRGVAASRLTSRGYGETQPIADNSTKDGRAMNRRVNLNVVK